MAVLLTLAACGGGSDSNNETGASAAQQQTGGDTTSASTDTGSPSGVVASTLDLDAAVTAVLVAERGEQVRQSYGSLPAPVVEVQRRSADGRWIFGGGYFPVPPTVDDTSPVTALFIAHRTEQGWEVGLEDSARFNELAGTAPEEIMSTTERQLFVQRQSTHAARDRESAQSMMAAQSVGLSLPFQLRGSTWGTAGVHGDSGSSRPYNAIDFWGGDGRVLASRGGIAYKFCTGGRWPFIKVVHDNGWTTGYYHLRNQATINNGQAISEGQFIGMIGVELPCGGRASGDHVHWTLWRGGSNGAAEPVHNKVIGGWTWYEGSQPYSGYAERNGTRVYANQRGLVNYGHDGGTTPPPSPCSGAGCVRYTGSLTQSGQTAFHPGTGGFQFGGGTLRAWLEGAPGTDFDLILGRYNGNTGQWDRVAGSDGPSSSESVSYNAPAGYYRWRINNYNGSGSYTLWTKQ
ncbi:M23 family metallopeptidase [Eleftheria terrae]|uniref:M23 family metallopeptidase n=1 Tax=Eleftheria terrae TaxID=1597781 RepID=UPI00263AFDBD|nr:peptidoglycan DD-metalloendopeptidase family protein [Eleftheria terrae]WKB55383.1 peptidoglycan DD-metalloendopeptidase family protein [Eleftheria terrae]